MGGSKRCYANGIVEFESSRLLQDWWLSNNIFCRSEDSVAKPLFLPPHFRGLECFLCFTRGFAAGGFGYTYAHPGRGSTPGYWLPPALRVQKFTEPSNAGFNFARPRRISILRRSAEMYKGQGTMYKLKASCAQRAQGIWSPARDGSSVAQGVSPGYKNKNNQSPERPVRA